MNATRSPESSQLTFNTCCKKLKNDHLNKYTVNLILIKMTNKMQLSRIIYYSIVPWLLYMFQVISSLIIRSILTVITASGFIQVCCCRLLSWLSRDCSYCNYS